MKTHYCPKTYFPNEFQANQYLSRLKATSHRSKVPKRAYLCLQCLNWHLTSHDQEEELLVKYRQKINELRKIIAEKNSIINRLRNEMGAIQ